MKAKLEEMMQLQEELNERIGIKSPNNEDEISELVLKMTRALSHEVIELEDCFKWKHWKKSQQIDIDNAKMEAIDCLHFLLSIFLALDMKPSDVLFKYLTKNDENHRRQKDGY